GLVFGDEKIDSLTAQKFAQALYSRGVAVLRFANETEAHDIEVFLRLLAAGRPGEQKRPIWEDLTSAGVLHINLQPVDYSSVRMTDDLEEEKKKEPTLWDEILRALIEGRELSAESEVLSEEPESADDLTEMILKYIDSAVNAKAAFDPDATFGVRMLAHPETPDQIHRRIADAVGRSLAQASGAKKQSMLQQAVQLLRSLPQPLRGVILQRMVATLATDDSAGAMLRELVSELPHDEVLEALRYLSSMNNLSAHALSLLQSLAAMDTSTRTAPASENVISDLVHLFGEDDVDRFNPPDHAALLEQVAVHVPRTVPQATNSIEVLGKRVETVADDALLRQVARTVVELITLLGSSRPVSSLLDRVERLFRSYLGASQFEDALELV